MSMMLLKFAVARIVLRMKHLIYLNNRSVRRRKVSASPVPLTKTMRKICETRQVVELKCMAKHQEA